MKPKLDVVILAGGFAKRMWPLTKDTPKQLLTLAGRPMLAYVLDKLEPLEAAGTLGRVFVSTNQAFADQFEDYLAGYSGSVAHRLKLIVEPALSEGQKLGSLGALGLLFRQQKLAGPLLILGSDNLYDFTLRPLVQAYAATGCDVVGLFDVEDIKLARLYGIAALDADEAITAFVEKPADPPSTLAATALWLLSPEGVAALLDYLEAGHDRDALGNFLAWRIKTARVMGHAYSGIWYDIGSIESYEAAQRWLEGALSP